MLLKYRRLNVLKRSQFLLKSHIKKKVKDFFYEQNSIRKERTGEEKAFLKIRGRWSSGKRLRRLERI